MAAEFSFANRVRITQKQLLARPGMLIAAGELMRVLGLLQVHSERMSKSFIEPDMLGPIIVIYEDIHNPDPLLDEASRLTLDFEIPLGRSLAYVANEIAGWLLHVGLDNSSVTCPRGSLQIIEIRAPELIRFVIVLRAMEFIR